MVNEWWTYRPSDLLMFSPRTYWRLFELHNEALWPVQALTALMALFVAGAIRQGRSGAVRAGAALLAACWALVAWTFLWQRYAPIHTAAGAFAFAFALQAGGLLLLTLPSGIGIAKDTVRQRTGLALLGWAVLAHPFVGIVLGRSWAQAEFFGLAPDPTVIGTLGVLLCLTPSPGSGRALLGVLWTIALSWCLVSAATLWTMGTGQGWLPVVGAALAMATVARRRT